MADREDLPLRTLLEVRGAVAPELPAEMVEGIYTILASRQFDANAKSALSFVDALIEDYLDQTEGDVAAAGEQGS